MNDSVLEKEKTANAVSSVENTENEKGVVTLSNGDKVDKATGEITKEGKKDDSVSINSNPDTEATATNGSETKANLPATTTSNKEEATAPTLSDEEKENQMRNEVNALDLKNLDVKLMYEMMSVPTYSNYEYRMVTWLILWARKHNIEHKFDDYGNLYFIKGKPADGHFYPCVTAHLDTVQNKAKAYILTGAELDLKTSVNRSGEHDDYIDGKGTGTDNKNETNNVRYVIKELNVHISTTLTTYLFTKIECTLKSIELLEHMECYKDCLLIIRTRTHTINVNLVLTTTIDTCLNVKFSPG